MPQQIDNHELSQNPRAVETTRDGPRGAQHTRSLNEYRTEEYEPENVFMKISSRQNGDAVDQTDYYKARAEAVLNYLIPKIRGDASTTSDVEKKNAN